MTALWLEPAPRSSRHLEPAAAPDLRLLGSRPLPRTDDDPGDAWGPDGARSGLRLVGSPERRPRRHVSVAVRRRRTLLAVIGILLIGLALPLSGTGGRSHAAGSALSESSTPFVYTVQPGDTLWSIAQRLDPSADPRPLVARLTTQTGSDTVIPGERITLP